VSPLPLSIGEVMSLHPRKDTTRNRVCKHALVERFVNPFQAVNAYELVKSML
jgi:hypothetical protein